ncbi:hypothetical protein Gotur_034766 [Gossypium turneri]
MRNPMIFTKEMEMILLSTKGYH